MKQLGVYDRVVGYEEIDQLPRSPAAFFDMAGNAAIRGAVHRRFSDALTHSAIVGRTHWDETASGASLEPLPGAEPTMFSVAVLIQQRTRELGPSVVQERLGQAWQALLQVARDPKRGWLEVVEAAGPAAVERTYREVIAGRMNPGQGHVLSLRG